MKLLKAGRIATLSVALCLATTSLDASAKPKSTPASPETLLCPATYGDLEYGLYKTMDAAKFQEWGGHLSWRRKADGPFHLASLENAHHLRVQFRTFQTSEGTRLIADLWWQTSSYEIGVKQQEVVDIFQELIDEIARVFPCR